MIFNYWFIIGVRTHDFTKDAKSSIYNTVVTDDCSASSPSIKRISQQPTGKQTFVIAKGKVYRTNYTKVVFI